MKQSIKERIHALRMTFRPNNIKAFIIPSTDPHLSEYVVRPVLMLTLPIRMNIPVIIPASMRRCVLPMVHVRK